MPRPLIRLAALVGLAAVALAAAPTVRAADDWKLDSDTFEGLKARHLGPGSMSGRITCLDGVPGERVTLWAGTAGGGVWRSRDAGTTWRPVFDGHPQSIGDLAVSKRDPKVVWVGTGESWTRNSVGMGYGVYKTTDGGDSWKRMGLEKSERISRVAIDPLHPDTVLVAALGPLFAPGGERGVYRTIDGGRSWQRTLYVDEHTGAADLVMDPQNPRVVYAAMWQVRRQAWTFASGGPGSGLYKSTDGGATWKKLTRGLPAGELGRIGLAVSPTRPNRIYAVVESKETAFYRSDDTGESWERLNDSNANVTWRPFYFARVVADPQKFDRVYKGGLTLSVSDDAGKTFGGGGAMGGSSYHSDVHALWIDPNDTEFLVMGTDGGVYISMDRGTTWRFCANIPVGQFYHVSYDMQFPYNVYGGLQDNGTWRGPSRHTGGIPNRKWDTMLGGDGFWAFTDPADDDLLYCMYQGGNLSRVRMSTGETRDIKPLRRKGDPALRFNWNAALHAAPSGALYMGSQFLMRTRDQGDHWEVLSGDLTTNDPLKQQQDKSGGLSVDNSSAENHCTIFAIAESPKDASTIWVGTDDGQLQLTRDGGKSWTNVTRQLPGLPPNTWISSVCASPHDAATAFVAADGHYAGDMRTYLFVTRDHGRTFQSIADSTIRGYAHVVKQDLVHPDLLFAGTHDGLFCSLDGGRQWAQIRAGLPDVEVRDLAIHPREGDLIVATHGRGIYIIDDLSPLRSLTRQVLASDGAFLTTRPQQLAIPRQQQRFDGDTDWAGDNLPETAVINYYLKKRHVIGDLKLEIFDATGRKLTTLSGGKRRGINRVEWPMRLKGPRIPPAANLVPNFFAFVGPRAAEGKYKVVLTRHKETYESTVELVPDPRSTHSPEDRAAQSKLVGELYDMLNDLSYTVEGAVELRNQARARADSLGSGDALAKRLRTFADRVESFRGTIVAAKEGGRLTGEERLREHLGDLYGKVNGYEGRPTGGQVELKSVLEGELRKAESDWKALVAKELPGVNAALKGRRLPELRQSTRAEWDEARNRN